MTAVFHQVPSALHFCYIENDLDKVCLYNGAIDVPIRSKSDKKWGKFRARVTVSRYGSRKRVIRRWKLYAIDTRVLESSPVDRSNANAQNPTAPSIEIPVTCYQILGVSDRAEKDEIVKAVMHLKNAEIEDGYTMDAVVSRQNLLVDVRDKLLFEPEYAGSIKEKVPPRSSLRISWAWLPSALCLLQEVGEEKLVLNIGQKALQHPDSKPYVHDILLSMALAECAIAKVGFEKNKISQGFEALARAQCLLRSKVSLGKMTLLSQIEESLEELAPACTLELLGMPRTPENAERRLGAIAALRELLRQGLDVEASCQVQDWQCFLNQALNKLMASEIVELLQWHNLALTRKNKKSIESQNQRAVIDFNCFYMVLLAHIALGFSSKQIDLINKSKIICECLIASEGVDLKFEEAFLLFLLGQGDEAAATEKLRQLELNSDPVSRKLASVTEKDASTVSKPLETWVKDAVLGLFPDTRDCSPSFQVNFFRGEKRPFASRENRRGLHTTSHISHRTIAPAIPRDQRALDEPLSYGDTSRHLGSAVQQLAPHNLQAHLTVDKVNVGNAAGMPSVQLKRNLGAGRKVWEIWLGLNGIVEKIIFVVSVGCVIFVSLRLMNTQLWRMKNGSAWWPNSPRMTSSHSWTMDFPQDPSYRRASSKRSGIVGKLRKMLPKFIMQIGRHPQASGLQNSFAAAGLSPSTAAAYKTPMPMEEAETLVKKWQTIKAEALGPDHNVDGLFDVLDEPMLVQWQGLSEAAKTSSCFWRFVLLQLSVLRAEILTDGTGQEMAEIEAILEEAAELVDESQLKNPNYYSTYKIRYVLKRQDDGSWRFSEGDILTES
ncbi:PREDICTED: plastid division protein CDP1, chloroplastic isoform X1 [Nicotiana attenuata]|uniref:Plastid division protein cdp1, chloroplastic n=1 Tax=Nicotiana attenuata TaxID=49451 RepID=A0A1J6IIM9_NICAT|nr:PREDICTED: plastid division protein CDP1, chloroplastic isoform X1 [Nicotiana attenuata]OIT04734.1 plastid division protein cdp1, chloroplastic [Nicotiana attenuata]